MSLKIGANNNIPKGMTGAWIGAASNTPKKILNAWIGNASNVPKLFYTAETPHGQQVFISSGTFTVPSGVSKIDIFCVGGAGGNCDGSYYESTSGSSYLFNGMGYEFTTSTGDSSPFYAQGGSGYTTTQTQVSVTSGETLSVVVGAKGNDGTGRQYEDGTVIKSASDASNGGTSGVYRSSTALCSASGGNKASSPLTATSSTPSQGDTTINKGGNGGSGGRSAGLCSVRQNINTGVFTSPAWGRCVHGRNGSNGGDASDNGTFHNYYSDTEYSWTISSSNLATGQGSTTKAFGESSGTLYDNFGDGGTVIIRW